MNVLVSINYASDFGEVGTVFNLILLILKQTQSNFVNINSKLQKWDQGTKSLAPDLSSSLSRL